MADDTRRDPDRSRPELNAEDAHGEGQSYGEAGGYNRGPGQSYGGFGGPEAGGGSGSGGGPGRGAGGYGGGQGYTGQTGTGYGRTPGGSRPEERYGRGDDGPINWARHALSGVFGGGDRRHDGPHCGRGPKGYTRSDDRVRDDVNDRLTDDPFLDATHIEVAVQAGEVTLSGTVTSRADKRRAEDLADNVSGAKHVQNNLRVQEAGSNPER